MKKGILLLGLLLMAWTLNPIPTFSAQRDVVRQTTIWDEAKEARKGHYSPDDLARWRKRLKKSQKKRKWKKVALCHNVIGVIHYYEGNPDRALKHLNKSLRVSRKKGFEKMVMRNLFWVGSVQKRIGLHEEAMKNLRESMTMARSLGERGREGRCARLIGLIMLGKGRYQESMDYLKQAFYLAEENRDERLMMSSLNSMGLVHKKQGNMEKAEAYFSRSLQFSEKVGDKKWKAANVNGLGDICLKRKDYDCALQRYQQSVALSEAFKDKMALAKAYNRIGMILLRKKRAKKALQYFEKAHESAIDAGARVYVAGISKNMGKAYGRMTRWDDALKKTNDSIEVLEEVDIPDSLRDCFHMKGKFLGRKGDMVGAERYYKKSVKILETLREDVAGGEEEMLAFVEKRGKVYQDLIALLLTQGKVAEALEYLERSRLKNLRDQFDQLSPILMDEREEEAREKEKGLREEIEAARVQLTQEKSKPKEMQNMERISQLDKRLNAKRQEYIEHVNSLREAFPHLASILAIQPDTLIDLQSLLPPHVGLLQYLLLEDQLYIFLVTHKSLFHKEVKITQKDLEEKIEHFRGLLRHPETAPSRGLVKVKTSETRDRGSGASTGTLWSSFFKTSEALYQHLIKPLGEELAQFEILGIIPNGRLHLLSFQALGEKGPNGEFRYLAEDKALFHLNSQSILKFAKKEAKQIGGEGKLMAFGNPDRSLMYAEEEIERLRHIFYKSETFTREAASEDKLKSGVAGYDVLHLATHAKMQDDVKESYILLAKSADGKEDGKLFLREIWGLPLRGYQLVTLSACETAKGSEASGDVMVSLETAFLRAGTPTIVASLWEVDDRATGILMKSFYQHLMKKEKAVALRAAQVALMKDPKYAYPFYWAPFILVGDWR